MERHVISGPHRVVPEGFQALDELELLGRRMERELGAEADHAGHRGNASRTPPSTVSVQPVVLADRSEARTSAPPSPCAVSTRMASRATMKWPVALTANERSQSASSRRTTGEECATPAFDTRTSRPP